MLQNMAQNLQRLDYSSLGPIVTALRNINLLMARAQGIAFQVDSTEREFARLYPKHYAATVTTDELARAARGPWEHSMDALRPTMLVPAQGVENVEFVRAGPSRRVHPSPAPFGHPHAPQPTTPPTTP